MSAPSFCRERTPCRRIVGGDDRVQAPDPERGNDREPDRAAADDERHLAALYVGLVDGMDADRQRLGQRGMLRREASGNFQQQWLAE